MISEEFYNIIDPHKSLKELQEAYDIAVEQVIELRDRNGIGDRGKIDRCLLKAMIYYAQMLDDEITKKRFPYGSGYEKDSDMVTG